MPCTPIALRASRTSSSLNGLTMAVTIFMGNSFREGWTMPGSKQLPCHRGRRGRRVAGRRARRAEAAPRMRGGLSCTTKVHQDRAVSRRAGAAASVAEPRSACGRIGRTGHAAGAGERDVVGRGSQPLAGRAQRAAGAGRGAPGQRAAELHPGRPGRHRGARVARARARGACAQRAGLPAQQAHHGQPRTGRPAEGFGAL